MYRPLRSRQSETVNGISVNAPFTDQTNAKHVQILTHPISLKQIYRLPRESLLAAEVDKYFPALSAPFTHKINNNVRNMQKPRARESRHNRHSIVNTGSIVVSGVEQITQWLHCI